MPTVEFSELATRAIERLSDDLDRRAGWVRTVRFFLSRDAGLDIVRQDFVPDRHFYVYWLGNPPKGQLRIFYEITDQEDIRVWSVTADTPTKRIR